MDRLIDPLCPDRPHMLRALSHLTDEEPALVQEAVALCAEQDLGPWMHARGVAMDQADVPVLLWRSGMRAGRVNPREDEGAVWPRPEVTAAWEVLESEGLAPGADPSRWFYSSRGPRCVAACMEPDADDEYGYSHGRECGHREGGVLAPYVRVPSAGPSTHEALLGWASLGTLVTTGEALARELRAALYRRGVARSTPDAGGCGPHVPEAVVWRLVDPSKYERDVHARSMAWRSSRVEDSLSVRLPRLSASALGSLAGYGPMRHPARVRDEERDVLPMIQTLLELGLSLDAVDGHGVTLAYAPLHHRRGGWARVAGAPNVGRPSQLTVPGESLAPAGAP